MCRLLLLVLRIRVRARARARSCIYSHISFSLTPGIRMSRSAHLPTHLFISSKIRCTFYQGAVATIAPAEQTCPAFFSSFSRINNSPVYTRRVKLTVYYPLETAINSLKRQLELFEEYSCAILTMNLSIFVKGQRIYHVFPSRFVH